MLTKIELIAFSILAAYIIVGLYWVASSLVKYILFSGKEKKKIRGLKKAEA